MFRMQIKDEVGVVDRTGPVKRRRAKHGAGLAWLKAMIKDPGEECQIWPFGRIKGYGHINGQGTRRAHRLALILYSGRDPKHLEAAHGPCHNPLCCNPRHLSWLTRKENSADMLRDGTSNRGEAQGSSKLTEDEVRAIRADGRVQTVIAKAYGVNQALVSLIKNRKRWAHI